MTLESDLARAVRTLSGRLDALRAEMHQEHVELAARIDQVAAELDKLSAIEDLLIELVGDGAEP